MLGTTPVFRGQSRTDDGSSTGGGDLPDYGRALVDAVPELSVP
jgi:hypothetical protein